MLLSLFALTVPSWIARFGIRRERIGLKGLEDLGVGALFLLLFQGVPYLPFVCVPLFQCLILLDAYMERKLQLRLEKSFFVYLFHLGEFRDSAKSIKIYQWAPVGATLALLPLLVFKGGMPHFSVWSLCALCLPLGTFKWKKGCDHLLTHYLRPQRRGKKDVDPTPFLSKNERYTVPFPRYPLYRFTTGFRGRKSFDLEVKKGEKPHVVFLFVESLAQRNLGTLTPHLDRIAKEGIVFPHFYSNSLQTFRAIYAALFGIPYALTTEVTLDPKLPLTGLIDLLKKEGYRTNFFNAASWTLNNLRVFLKEHGGDVIADNQEIRAALPHVEEFSWGVFDEYLFDYTLDHMKKHRETPQFYSLSTITTHHPYILPKGEITKEGDYEKFLQTLAYADRCIGTFIEGLEREGMLENTLLFIMGDHGNLLNEDNQTLFFSKKSDEESFHVPLILYGKGRGKKGQVVETEGSQCDLLPTLMDLLHLQGEHHSIGKSLLREGTHPFFLYNASNPKDDFYVRRGDPSLIHCIDALYSEKKLFPKESQSMAIAHYEPSKELAEEALIDDIQKKGPMSEVHFSGYRGVTDRVLQAIADRSPDLGLLDLKMNMGVTDRGVASIIKKCHELLDLDLSYCPLLTEETLHRALELPNLDALAMDGLDFIDDRCIQALEKKKHRLMQLSLVNTFVSDLSLLCPLFPYLSSASFSYSQIDPESLPSFIAKQPLYRLDLYECQNLTDALFSKLTGVKFLVLDNCSQLSDDAFLTMHKKGVHSLTLLSPTNLTDRGLEALLNLPLSHLEIQGGVSLTEKGLSRAREVAPKYAHLRIEGGSPFYSK